MQDPKFEEHFTNARNAGLRVGVYCFSQAVNENEAREEAQACVYVLNGRQLDYPIYFDTEASGAGNGRADGLGVEDRTKCAVAFCEEVKALGYKPGVYASTTWFRKRVDLDALRKYHRQYAGKLAPPEALLQLLGKEGSQRALEWIAGQR